MRSGIWSAIRWLVAIAALGAVVVVATPRALESMRDSISFERNTPTPTAPDPDDDLPAVEQLVAVQDGAARPFFDFHASGGIVADPLAETLRIGPDTGDALYLAFEPIEGDLECLQEAQLHVPLLRATPADLIAVPAAGLDVRQVGEGDSLPVPPLLEDSPGGRAITDGSPGILLWNVTSVYQAWAAGPDAQDGAPFILVVRAEGEDSSRRLEFASAEAGDDNGPQLSWVGVANCGAPAEDGGDVDDEDLDALDEETLDDETLDA